MAYEVDPAGREPLYVQIAAWVRSLIATREMRPGDQLPTVRDLAADLGVNFNTVARAYRRLEEEGVVSAQRGRGTFLLEVPALAEGEGYPGEALEGLVAEWLVRAQRMGFELEEVEAALARGLRRWERAGAERKGESEV